MSSLPRAFASRCRHAKKGSSRSVLNWNLVRIFAAFVCASALAQVLIPTDSVDAHRIEESFEKLMTDKDVEQIDCSFTRYPPRLGFTFKHWAGYDVSIPARQFSPSSITKPIVIVARVTPKGGKARYLLKRFPLPKIPENLNIRKVDFYISGGFAIGAGEYEVAVVAVSDESRVCRKSWKISASESKVPLRIEPGTVAEPFMDTWTGISGKQTEKQITVFLNMAPLLPRLNIVHLSPWDQAVLLGSLTSLLDTSQFSRARVIAYNLDLQRILLDDDNFGRAGYEKLRDEMQDLNLGVISVNTLKSLAPAAMLEKLVRKEIANPVKSEAVVFLGPLSRYEGRLPQVLKELGSSLPPTSGILFFPRPGYEDIVGKFVSACGGKTSSLYAPTDLAKAIRTLNEANR